MQAPVVQSLRCVVVLAPRVSFFAARRLLGTGRIADQGAGKKGGQKRALTPLVLLEEDIDERFVKGRGPGGQKINKVRNCVQLTHKPTGVTVSCQEARELVTNRSIARSRLREKVEFHLRGDDSKAGRRIARIRNRKARSKRKSRIKHGANQEGGLGKNATGPDGGKHGGQRSADADSWCSEDEDDDDDDEDDGDDDDDHDDYDDDDGDDGDGDEGDDERSDNGDSVPSRDSSDKRR